MSKLIFLELGIAQTTQTVTGVVLIVVQSVLTGLLAILIAVNAIIACCKENPHRKRRKEAEKLNRDLDNLTPLDARNSLLNGPMALKPTDTNLSMSTAYSHQHTKSGSVGSMAKSASNLNYYASPVETRGPLDAPMSHPGPYRAYNPPTNAIGYGQSNENLVQGAAPVARGFNPSRAGTGGRAVPNLEGYGGYRGVAY
jgi:hypothetical protein